MDEYVVGFSWKFFSLPFISLFVLLKGIPNVDIIFWLMILSSGGLDSIACILYMRAIKSSPLSLTVPMMSFSSPLLLLTSPIMLGESPNVFGAIGVILIVFGTYVISLEDLRYGGFASFKMLRREKGIRLMLGAAIITSITANLNKIGIQHSDPLFFLLMWNVFVSALLFPAMLMKSQGSIKIKSANLAILFLIGLCNALMLGFLFYALELASVPYIMSARRTNIIFSALFGYLFFKEKYILPRLTGTLTMFLGVLVLSLL